MDSVIVNRTEIIRGSKDEIQSLKEAFLNGQNVKESSRNLYSRTLKQFFLWVGRTQKALSELTRVDILEYKGYLENELKTFEKGFLTDEKSSELLAYFEGVSLRDYAIVNLMLRTGLRTIEVTRATIGDITFNGEQRTLKVWGKGKTEGEKGKDWNFVILTDKAYIPIKNYLEATRKGAKAGEPLFTSTSHQNSGQQLTTRTVSRICKDGLKAIGLDSREYTAHSLRHTTASSLLEHGINLLEVSHVLRHSSTVTTQIYTKMKEKELRIRNAPEAALDNAF